MAQNTSFYKVWLLYIEIIIKYTYNFVDVLYVLVCRHVAVFKKWTCAVQYGIKMQWNLKWRMQKSTLKIKQQCQNVQMKIKVFVVYIYFSLPDVLLSFADRTKHIFLKFFFVCEFCLLILLFSFSQTFL